MPHIRVLLGYQQGQVFPLTGRTLVIGRDLHADIVLHPDSAASRRHAEVYAKNGDWCVRDLASANGTQLNGLRAADSTLRDRDEIVIGDNVFIFEAMDAAASETAAAAGRAMPAEPKGIANRPDTQSLVAAMSGRAQAIAGEVEKSIPGQHGIVLDVLAAILSRGHVLLNGSPGPAKTTLARAISGALDLKFQRIHFTADLVPADLTGIADAQTGKVARGPIFTQMLLADEINRTPPGTQTALLDVMRGFRVNASGQSLPMESPFVVLATQNPIALDGAFPLSAAQLDQFMFSLHVDYPGGQADEQFARATSAPQKVLDARKIISLQNAVRDLPASDHVVNYAIRLVSATHPAGAEAPVFVKRYIQAGAGPRAAQCLVLGAKARAVMDGRLHVTTSDVRSVVRPVLRHRIVTNIAADRGGLNADRIIRELLLAVAEPGDGECDA